MENMGVNLTEEDIESIKIVLAILLFIPGLLLLRFLVFLILPKGMLKFFFRKKQGFKQDEHKKKNQKFWQE